MGEDCARLTAPDGGRVSAGWFTWRLLMEGVKEGVSRGEGKAWGEEDPGTARPDRDRQGSSTPVGRPGVGREGSVVVVGSVAGGSGGDRFSRCAG
ncbi:hypothetical protein GCM10009540_47790 [Streptomyces turgidiscabies]